MMAIPICLAGIVSVRVDIGNNSVKVMIKYNAMRETFTKNYLLY